MLCTFLGRALPHVFAVFFWNCCKQGEIQLSLFLSFPLPRLSHYLSVSVFEEVTCLNLFHEIRSYLLFVDEQILLGS